MHYSNHKFGFTIQKKLWLECGGKIGEYNGAAFKKFALKVGWCSSWYNWRSYTEFMSDTNNAKNALPASLPKVVGRLDKYGIWWGWEWEVWMQSTSSLFLRIKNCRK